MLLDEYYRADPELRDVWIALPGAVRAQILQWDARRASCRSWPRALRISCKAPVRSAPFSGRSAGLFWKREPAGRPALSFCGEKQ